MTVDFEVKPIPYRVNLMGKNNQTLHTLPLAVGAVDCVGLEQGSLSKEREFLQFVIAGGCVQSGGEQFQVDVLANERSVD